MKMRYKWGVVKLMLLLMFGFGAAAQNINTSNKTGPMGLQVNTLTGNLFIPRSDLYIPARGFDLAISFYYNSFNYNQNIGFGNGWSFNYYVKYRNDSAAISVIWGDGREDTYDYLGSGIYKSPKGFFSALSEYQPNKFLLTEKDGTKFFFDNNTNKRITRMEDPNGNYVAFTYTDTSLTSIANAAGQSISFTYTNGKLTGITDAIVSPSRSFTYTYDAAGNLAQVKDPLNGTNKYTYLVNGPLKTVTDKNNNTVDVVYYSDFTISELIGCNKRISFSYDSSTLSTFVTDHMSGGNNQVTKYEYKKNEDKYWLAAISGNCCGFNMKFEFDASGNKTKQTDANGNVTSYTYDSRGNMLTMTDALNQTITYTYSTDFNNVTSFKDKKGFITTLQYDSRGNLTQMTEPGNLVYSATYNSQGDIISSTDPKGNVFTYNRDAFGNPTTVTGPNGYSGTLGFDGRGHLLSFTDARGNQSTIEYDILDRLKKITDPINLSLQVNYDAAGNPVAVTNENNETSILNFDASNRLVKLTDPKGNITKVEYDEMDNVKTVTNPLNNSTRLDYDTRNRISGATDAIGNRATVNYDGIGNIISLVMPNGQTTNFAYDQLNRVIAASDINGPIATFTYDPNNNIISHTNGTGATSTAEYDNLNRTKKVTDPLGNFVTLTYDDNSNIASITDRNGSTTGYTYDSVDRIKTYTNNNGHVITLGYDVAGNIISVKDQNNNTTQYAYDSLNRVKRTTYPDGKFMEFGYDKKSNIISKRLTDGTTILLTYDSLNRIIARTLPDGQVYSYGYDALGRVISANNNAGTVTLTYDALDRVKSETFDGRTVTYDYNISGRTKTTVYPDSTVIIKSYDTRNRLISISKNNSVLVTYQYNNANQVTAKTFANGVTSSLQYDFANRLSSISTSNGTIQNSSFTYDNERNKTIINRLNNPSLSEQFSYDNGHRLTNYKRGPVGSTPLVQNTYNYDAVGNRISANLNGVNTAYSSNNLNQLINSNNGSQNINFTYDDRGNLTYDGFFFKFYDSENRLIKDSSSPSNVLTYQYDAFGRRVWKSLNGNILKYTYSGFAQIEERNGSNTLLNRNVYMNFLSPVISEKGSSRYYYHQNEMNSVEAITNNSGNLVERYQYDAYGAPSIYDPSNSPLASSIAGNHFGFAGQEYDSANGNYHFYFRNYSPSTGSFAQRDLIGYDDGMGMYQYVHNNPANGIDIFGLKDCPPEEQTSVVNTVEKVESWENFLFGSYEYYSNEIKNPRLQAEALKKLSDMQKQYNKLFDLTEKMMSKGKFGIAEQLAEKGQGILENMKNVKIPDVAKMQKAAGALKGLGLGLNAIDVTIKGYHFGDAINQYNAGNIDGAQLTQSGGDLAQSGLGFTPVGALYNLGDFAQSQVTGKSMNQWSAEYGQVFGENSVDQGMDEELMEWHRNNGTLQKFLKAYHKTNAKEFRKNNDPDCPQNDPGGTQRRRPPGPGITDQSEIISSNDPNEIIGPDGQPDKRWVSVKDRLPYTILFENSQAASAPAKYVKVISPIHTKMDAATFQLGSFGFNSLTFAVPPSAASYYQRLDCRDSLGLYVDVTAGYDQINNQAFWEFQSIDPLTLLPPGDPLKGFLLLRDSSNQTSGHGFVNFSIKPVTGAQTSDTILANADIIFDTNDTIPTNDAKNTIDALPPVSSITDLPNYSPDTEVSIHYTGHDDTGGSGVKWYSIFISDNNGAPELYVADFRKTDTTFRGVADHFYKFYISAVDSTANTEAMKFVDSIRIISGEIVICPNGSTTFDSKLTGATYQWQVDAGSGYTNIGNGGVYSNTDSAVLHINNAPTSMYGYLYRCKVNGTLFSQEYILKFGMNWEGTINNAWENPANWSCGSLPDANTDVIVDGGKVNYPQVNSNTTIRTLRLNPGSSININSGFTLTIIK